VTQEVGGLINYVILDNEYLSDFIKCRKVKEERKSIFTGVKI
jgi:hypothetical protein